MGEKEALMTGATTTSRRRPTPEQAAAINLRAARILLEAGAGTGKTMVLVDRYCDRIEHDELRPEEILAFTFTDKAAAEMGERIRSELMRRAGEAGDSDRARRLRDAAHRLSGAWVMTMHAFCRRVLAAHPVAAGLDPELTVFDQATGTRIERAAFDLALDEFVGGGAGAAELAAAYGIAGLRNLIVATYRQLRSYGQLEPKLPDCPEVDVEAALAELERAAEAMFAGDFRAHAKIDEKIRRAQAIAADRGRWLVAAGLGSEACRDAVAELTRLNHNSRVEVKAAVEIARRKALAALLAADQGAGAYSHICELLRLFGLHYTALKQSRSGIDYDDMQLLAADLLRRNQALAGSYRDRFREVMVDEFQDTSAVQMQLISTLRGPQTTLFEVGDEFQSIYRFRGADLENFRSERRRLKQDPDSAVLPLRGNFRSRAAILAAANAFTSSLIPGFQPLTVGSAEQGEATGDADQDFETGVGGAAKTAPEVEMIVTAPEGWEDDKIRPAPPPGTTRTRAAEAAAVAAHLAKLAACGVPRGDMVVLLRTRTSAGAYVSALEELGLAPFVVGGRGFWLGREIADATALLRAVANPLDDEGLFGALASPACAASPDALWLLRRAAGPGREIWPLLDAYFTSSESGRHSADSLRLLDEIEPDDRERLRRFHTALCRLHRDRGLLSLPALVERALTLTGVDLATLSAPQGDLRWAGLRKLIRKAAEYESAEGRDLRGLLEHGELAREVDGDGEAVIAAEGHDGVRLMTVHAAKGLEFPVVVVPELGRDPGAGATRNAPDLRVGPDHRGGWRVGLKLRRIGGETVPTFDYDLLAAEDKLAGVEEEMRLFYVAMTRAERRLVLSGVGPKGPLEEIKPSTPILHRLLDRFDTSGGELLLPAAAAREGLNADFPAVRVAVHPNEPSEDGEGCAPPSTRRFGRQEAAASSGRRPLESSPAGLGNGQESTDPPSFRPPIDPIPTEPILPPLSFTGLAAFAADPAGYVSELRLGGARQATGDAEQHERSDEFANAAESSQAGGPQPGDDLPEGENRARAFGSAAHVLLEQALSRSGRRRWQKPTRTAVETALRSQGLAPAGGRVDRLVKLVEGWLESPLCAEISEPTTRLRSEVALTFRPDAHPDALIHGSIDLLAEPLRTPIRVIDYKTNNLAGRDPEAVIAADYELQAKIYALAVSRAFAVGKVEVAFVLLECPDSPVERRFGPAELTAAEAEIDARITDLRDALRLG